MPAPTNDQLAALQLLFDQAYGHDNGGALVCQRFLLGLYNGRRFPFDLTDLRRLDFAHFEACVQVLAMENGGLYREVHDLLALYQGKPTGWMSLVFEQWGYDQRLPGRCKKGALDDLRSALKARAARDGIAA